MDIFFTKLALKQGIKTEQFVDLIKRWIINSPIYNIKNIKYNCEYDLITENFGLYRLTFLRINLNECGDVCAVRFINQEEDNTWFTDIIFVKNTKSSFISIKLSCTSEKFSPQLPQWHTPYIVKILIESKLCAEKEHFPISKSPIYLQDIHIPKCIELFTKGLDSSLPIVYVSYDQYNPQHYSVSCQRLAAAVSGFAHVVVEPSKEFSLSLKGPCQNRNIYNGYVGICFPNNINHIILSTSDFSSQGLINAVKMEHNIRKCLISSILYHVNNEELSWHNILLEYQRNKYLNNKDSVDDYIDAFDKELNSLKIKNDSYQKEIERLTNENANLKKHSTSLSINLSKPSCDEFYKDEFRDCILCTLQKSMHNIANNSRQKEILENILKNNKIAYVGKTIFDELEKILNLPPHRRNNELKRLGFTVTSTDKHTKIYFGSSKYSATLSNTPSDHRSVKNLKSDILKQIDFY